LWSERKSFSIQQYGKCEKMDYRLLLQPALRAVSFADVRSGILPPQSGLRRNDMEV
jgi:hypothetical protein